MLEETWHTEFPRRSEFSDGLFPNVNVGLPMWDSYPVFATRPKKEEKVGLAEAITSSILSTGRFVQISSALLLIFVSLKIPLAVLMTGRIDLQRKLFCSIQLVSFGNME